MNKQHTRVTEALLRRALDAVRCYDSRSNLVFELEEGLRQLANATEEAHAQADIRLADALAATGETLAAANATLELVRYALEKVNQNGDLIDFRGRVTVALASQPEAHEQTRACDCAPIFREEWLQPEAPKGPAAEAETPTREMLLKTVHHLQREVRREKDRRVEHVQRNHSFNTALQHARRDLAAANARAEELTEKCYKAAQLLLEANARADAAEREVQELCGSLRVEKSEQVELAQKLEATERRLGQTDTQLLACITERNGVHWQAEQIAAQRDQIAQKLDAAERKAEQYLEAQRKEILAWHSACDERDQIAQKLDAAERELGALRATEMQLRDERDLLAAQLTEARADNATTLAKWESSAQEVERLTARVTELEERDRVRDDFVARLQYTQSHFCSPEERQVLETTKDIPDSVLQLSRDSNLDYRRAWAEAIIANRAAKAKAKCSC